MSAGKEGYADQRRIAAALEQLGWKRQKQGWDGRLGSTTSHLSVSTSKETQRDVSGSRVQIFGRVKLNFKTDLLPLAASPP